MEGWLYAATVVSRKKIGHRVHEGPSFQWGHWGGIPCQSYLIFIKGNMTFIDKGDIVVKWTSITQNLEHLVTISPLPLTIWRLITMAHQSPWAGLVACCSPLFSLLPYWIVCSFTQGPCLCPIQPLSVWLSHAKCFPLSSFFFPPNF